jgi:hypothetical protein
MAENYFSKFPLVNYNNYAAVNITERAILSEESFRNPYLFYSYDLSEGERPDQLANQYYNDQYMSWLLYLSNGVIDPYYDWYISEKDFHLFLCKKYFDLGLVVQEKINILKSKIMFYRNNWYEDKDIISSSEYSSMPVELHRYWEAVYDGTNVILGYKRIEEDWSINTNKFVRYAIVDSMPAFIKDEIVNITGADNLHAKGQISDISTDNIVVKNFSGSTGAINTAVTIRGTESNVSASFTFVPFGKDENNKPIDVLNNLKDYEVSYWSAVSVYDYEKENNEQKRTVNVVDANYAMKISKQLTNMLK